MKTFDQRFDRVSFADQLRQELDAFLLPQNAGLFWEKPYSPEIRALLQWWGTDLRRAVDPNYWVKQAEIQAQQMEWTWPVFTDVRFPNEAQMIIENGGFIVRVMAPAEVRETRLGELPPEHASETALDEFPVDMHVTSTEENKTYLGQVARVVAEATFENTDFESWMKEAF
jgi:hypothetical protein